MNSGTRIAELEEENQRLKEENEMLLKIIDQMRVTNNRLIGRFVSADREDVMEHVKR